MDEETQESAGKHRRVDALSARCEQQRRGSRYRHRALETSSVGWRPFVFTAPRVYLKCGCGCFGKRQAFFHYGYGKSCFDSHAPQVAADRARCIQRHRALGEAHRVVVQPSLAFEGWSRSAPQTSCCRRRFGLCNPRFGSAGQQAGRCYRTNPEHLRRHTFHRRNTVLRRHAVSAEKRRVHESEGLLSQAHDMLGREESDNERVGRLSS